MQALRLPCTRQHSGMWLCGSEAQLKTHHSRLGMSVLATMYMKRLLAL